MCGLPCACCTLFVVLTTACFLSSQGLVSRAILFCRAFEDATLLKLRQAADRARAIQQLQTEDADQSHSDS